MPLGRPKAALQIPPVSQPYLGALPQSSSDNDGKGMPTLGGCLIGDCNDRVDSDAKFSGGSLPPLWPEEPKPSQPKPPKAPRPEVVQVGNPQYGETSCPVGTEECTLDCQRGWISLESGEPVFGDETPSHSQTQSGKKPDPKCSFTQDPKECAMFHKSWRQTQSMGSARDRRPAGGQHQDGRSDVPFREHLTSNPWACPSVRPSSSSIPSECQSILRRMLDMGLITDRTPKSAPAPVNQSSTLDGSAHGSCSVSNPLRNTPVDTNKCKLVTRHCCRTLSRPSRPRLIIRQTANVTLKKPCIPHDVDLKYCEHDLATHTCPDAILNGCIDISDGPSTNRLESSSDGNTRVPARTRITIGQFMSGNYRWVCARSVPSKSRICGDVKGLVPQFGNQHCGHVESLCR